ncbi:Metallo-dependent phosphatase-like protein, partial [Elsinoe ampelina]
SRFLVVSDTHDLDYQDERSPLRRLPKVDVLLHCGDLTQNGGLPEFSKAFNMIKNVDAEIKLVIAGNHDLELDPDYELDEPEDHKAALAIWTGPEAQDAGIFFLEEGTHEFVLSHGAIFSIYASPYTPRFGDWAFGHWHHLDRFNGPDDTPNKSIATEPIPRDIDIVMTHGPPKGILDLSAFGGHCGGSNLLAAVKRTRPRMHCFGHIHEGYGTTFLKLDDPKPNRPRDGEIRITKADSNDPPCIFDASEGTLMVNAALQTGPSEWANKPWLVEMTL